MLKETSSNSSYICVEIANDLLGIVTLAECNYLVYT